MIVAMVSCWSWVCDTMGFDSKRYRSNEAELRVAAMAYESEGGT
jgi:hypothetical protein